MEVVIKGLYMIFFRADRKEFELILKETRTTLISGLMVRYSHVRY